MELPFVGESAITSVREDEYRLHWQAPLAESGSLVLDARLADVASRVDLFGAVSRALGLPDGGGISRWSGFQDRLWEAATAPGGEVAVLVLREVDTLRDADPETWATVLEILNELAGMAHDNENTHVVMRFVLTGSTGVGRDLAGGIAE